ncbi:probable 39S ribosomal protein L45, mitochondrial [Venturia canescens]|uniref:probable 39S ribosomal protein L45, mitochondrial n=1 Tax=Venturia canescens TaxID=32260 RepID=UPI001C9C60F6|nr:probable 39S ribosomal protein L45, mitochondrial [Venturia canescens]XP_043266702.1 probable 39S ribosomal protein L45, mitochondrial [Venturia canescens]XP_043266703.1 probable 39S ribosomal protein L45, mitochondrial [Venturia canescens]XP_043266704.1 probable 39S ribosomal protein L45, mitochondrial [Venturia canescens]
MSVNATLTKVTALGNRVQSTARLLLPIVRNTIGAYQPVRLRRAKHWLPQWKKLRAAKVIKVDLPDYHEELTAEQERSKMKERGLLPARPWMERPIFISCTGSIIEQYVPPEGDGKFSALSTAGAKQKAEFVTKKGKTLMAIRKIKSYEEEFSVKEFPDKAQEIYIKAHEALVNKDKDALRMYVTELAYPQMMHNAQDKTIHWKFIESLELPRVVAVKSTNVITDTNYFAQITVRFHTQQTLAVYDRFGRLMSGSEIVKKDVLEYVVYEKHLSHEYGTWRLHGKILPAWAPPREYGERTFIEKPQDQEPQTDSKEAVSTVTGSTEVKPPIPDKDLPEVTARPIV